MSQVHHEINVPFTGPISLVAIHDQESGYLCIQVSHSELDSDGESKTERVITQIQLGVPDRTREAEGWTKYSVKRAAVHGRVPRGPAWICTRRK